MKNLILTFFVLSLNAQISAHTINYYPGGPLEIIKIGHPTLTMVAQEIPLEEIKTESIQKLITDMTETMKKAGGVGLAAPQVNVSKRLFVMKPNMLKKAEAVINPVVDYHEEAGTKLSTEGCLSIPGKKFNVNRYNKINVAYYNQRGEYVTELAEGFRAVVFQHEYDHLNGILIADFFMEEFHSAESVEEDVPRM